MEQTVFSAFVSGLSCTKFNLALSLMHYDSISKTHFYKIQDQMVDHIVKYIYEKSAQNIKNIPPESLVSFDVTWDHINRN